MLTSCDLVNQITLVSRADSSGKCNGCFVEGLVWGSVSQLLSWSIIDIRDDLIKLFRSDVFEVCFPGYELPQEAVCILVYRPFPSAVWMGEVDGDVEGFFQCLEGGEFLSIVYGEGMDEVFGDVSESQ